MEMIYLLIGIILGTVVGIVATLLWICYKLFK